MRFETTPLQVRTFCLDHSHTNVRLARVVSHMYEKQK